MISINENSSNSTTSYCSSDINTLVNCFSKV